MSTNANTPTSGTYAGPTPGACAGGGGKLTPQPSLVVSSHRTPHPFFTPTHLSFTDRHSGEAAGTWTSRRARKGRYATKKAHVHYAASPDKGASGAAEQGQNQSQGQGEMRRMESMAFARLQSTESKLKPGLKADISFWVAVAFTFGSAVWVVNGYLVWFPILRPNLSSTTFLYTADATAFIGGSIFEIGSYLMLVEALDRGRESNFGTALGRLLHHRRRLPSKAVAELEDKTHLGPSSSQAGGRASTTSSATINGGNGSDEDSGEWPGGAKGFVWWGKPLWHDMGYVAAVVQMFAATIFWVSTITGLPGVIPGFADDEGSTAIIDVFFWTPQVIGGTGFIVSSLILMIEVQKKWYIPKLLDIGWWIGFWNLIGAIGFMLCGALGYSSNSGAVYESGLSTFWGSWAFLIGSVCQLYEVIWREPADTTSGSDGGGGGKGAQ